MALTAALKKALSDQVREKTLVEPVLRPDYLQYLERVEIEDTFIETREGQTHIFIIRANNRTASCPVYVNMHGGGFVRPHGKRNLVFCAMCADRMGGIVIDLDYRLAPEYPYPAAFNEAYDTVQWVSSHAELLGIDPARIVVGGDSAGGSLTLAVALRVRETGDFKIRHLLVYYPATDMVTPPAEKPEADISMISPDRALAFHRLYLDDDEEAARSPYVSMCCAPDSMLIGLPDTLMITAGKDHMRFEAETFASRLVAAGVKVTSRRFLESRHSFIINCIDEWQDAHALILETLRQATAR